MWETKETLEGGLRIDRMWWAAIKVGAIVAVVFPRSRSFLDVTVLGLVARNEVLRRVS